METETIARWDIVTRLIGLMLHVFAISEVFMALPGFLAVPAAGAIALSGVRYWRIAVVVDPAKLTIRNWARTHSVPWANVTGWCTASDHLMVEAAGKTIYMEGTKQFPIPKDRARVRVDALLDRLIKQLRAVEGRA